MMLKQSMIGWGIVIDYDMLKRYPQLKRKLGLVDTGKCYKYNGDWNKLLEELEALQDATKKRMDESKLKVKEFTKAQEA